jgi:hypothetical protein
MKTSGEEDLTVCYSEKRGNADKNHYLPSSMYFPPLRDLFMLGNLNVPITGVFLKTRLVKQSFI